MRRYRFTRHCSTPPASSTSSSAPVSPTSPSDPSPLDLVKCNMQVDPGKYKDISSSFGILLQEQGLGGFFKGWMATLVGYNSQRAYKFGFYEFFKKCYSDIVGSEHAEKLKTFIYLAPSASAEVITDITLCPMEAMIL
ncbi:hypothetical protein GUJ93_ZPchr0006g43410 [Zizania palustris]|uniref:Uncharacterized protein n=1 Tax=Zizania palustris TaxID=103762 RepID=A0A8J5SR29_ZIZPA|nr:hypothetical protein GUJ93_ZPchr0006g43410 [Zizania palustris]